jgi:hypothetical protein
MCLSTIFSCSGIERSGRFGSPKKGIYEKVKELVANGGLLQDEVVSEVKAYGKDKMLDLDDESFMKVAKSLGVA